MSDDPDKFRVGDTVRVSNIPGPRMVITGFDPTKKAPHEPSIHCKWFDKRAELQGQWFPPRLLSRVAPWTERPGYRTALEKIRDEIRSDAGVITTMADGTWVCDFIDDVLDHVHERVAAPTSEATDAAD